MLRTIKLYGTLAIDSGVDSLVLDVNNPALLFRGLISSIPEFRKVASGFKQLTVVGTKRNAEQMEVIQASNILDNFKDCDTIHVLPAVEGDISIGAAEAVGLIVGASASSAAAVGIAIVLVAAIALEYGIAKLVQALAPKPTTGQSDSSFIFSGPVNATAQGGAVPIIYGTCLVGSTIIASNFLTVDVPVGTVANTFNPGNGGF
jgi:predicted phage tail protein